MNRQTCALFESFSRRRDTASYLFADLTEEIVACSPEEVLPALHRVEEAVGRGCHAAGFLSYEAAAGLDPSLPGKPGVDMPLLHFGIYRHRRTIPPGHFAMAAPNRFLASDWRPSWSPAEHAAALEKVRNYIAAGDTYQVNLTFRQRFSFRGDTFAFYRDLCRSQTAPFSAWLGLGNRSILSASPELFFRLDHGCLTVRPMKGTAPRGRWWEEDQQAKQMLREDAKERAENLMIVDLLRNDLGKIAETGSVRAESLFDIETLPTLHQMTSTVTAVLRRDAGLADIFQALFPCGSVTGAPKKRSMEIIAELEDSPRGIYTGCIGFVSPVGAGTDFKSVPVREANPYEAVFSVAIRTALIDSKSGHGEMGVGSGVTWDSRPDAEYRECLAKGEFALKSLPEFQLIETMLFTAEDGYFLLDRHLTRLRRSAAYFGFAFRPGPVRNALELRSASLDGTQKVRLLVDRKGTFAITAEPIPPAAAGETFPVAFAGQLTDSRDPFLYHKTTNRDRYQEELARHPDCADVIFVNERGEVTEGAVSNIVAKIDGMLVTPPLQSGLLPGVFRAELLKRGELVERVITPDELKMAEEIWLINSVRKWRRARLV